MLVSVHFSLLPHTSLQLSSVLFTSLQLNSYAAGSQRGKTLVLLWFYVLVMLPKFTSIHYFDCEKLPQPFTVHTSSPSIIFIIFVTVLTNTVDKVIASTKYLHLWLQTRLLVVLVIKHLQPLHNWRCGVQHCLGKMLFWFLQMRCIKQCQGKQTENGISSFVSCLMMTCSP